MSQGRRTRISRRRRRRRRETTFFDRNNAFIASNNTVAVGVAVVTVALLIYSGVSVNPSFSIGAYSVFIITTRILMNTDRFMQILLRKLLGHHLLGDREPIISSHVIQTVLCGNNSTNILPTNEAASSKNFEITLPDSLKSKSVTCDKPRIRKNDAHVHYPPPLSRKMSDTFNPVYFLHVGKAGGTSIDDLLQNILSCERKLYVGDLHYDWSYIQQRELPRITEHLNQPHQQRIFRGELDSNDDDYDADEILTSIIDVITFLRHPVSRSISQFYFSKKLKWAKNANATFLYQTFDQYIDDPNKTWFQPIADGESGTDFLAGIFPTSTGHWVSSDGRETDRKEYLRKNHTAACLLAAQRLEKTVWFGLLEDIDRSMILLQFTLGLPSTPILPKSNSGGGSSGRNHPPPSRTTVQKVEKYIPKDLWLYEYAKLLFEARWNYFMGCTYVPPELPPLPDFDIIKQQIG